MRWSDAEKLIVVANFSKDRNYAFDLKIPADVVAKWQLQDGAYPVKDQLYGSTSTLKVTNGLGVLHVSIKGTESFIFKL